MSEESLPVHQLGLDEAAGAAADAEPRPPEPAPLRLNRVTLTVVAAAVVYSAVAGGFRKLSAPAELATFFAGALICWLALRKGCRRFPAPDHVDGWGSAAWGAVLVVFGIWELYADFRGSTPAHPTLSILMGPVIAAPLNRAVGYLAWLAAGIWVVRR